MESRAEVSRCYSPRFASRLATLRQRPWPVFLASLALVIAAWRALYPRHPGAAQTPPIAPSDPTFTYLTQSVAQSGSVSWADVDVRQPAAVTTARYNAARGAIPSELDCTTYNYPESLAQPNPPLDWNPISAGQASLDNVNRQLVATGRIASLILLPEERRGHRT